ncbi:MAG: hypothetical protein KDE35_05620 [Geminicoccaceae bacterium]|nr:hypothetical protein [Geminicoccaceae bacterium]
MSNIVMQGVGYGFLVLGVLGLVLPVLQGFLFIAIGLIVLSRHAPWAGRLLDRLKAKHPKADELITRAEDVASNAGHRVADFFRART